MKQFYFKQIICVEPRTSVLSMTPPAAAARARAADIDRRPVRGAGSRRWRSVVRTQQTHHTSPLPTIDGDRQTDGGTDSRPLHRPCTWLYACGVNNFVHYSTISPHSINVVSVLWVTLNFTVMGFFWRRRCKQSVGPKLKVTYRGQHRIGAEAHVYDCLVYTVFLFRITLVC